MGTIHILRCSFAVVLALFFSAARADVVDPAFNRFRSQVVGNSVQFSYGTGGTPLAGGASSAGTSVPGGVDVSRGVAISTKHGPIVGSLSQRVSGAAMGKAFARAGAVLGGPIGLAFLALPAIVEWMDDADVRRSSNGQFESITTEGLVCTSGSCPGWGFQTYPSVAAKYTYADACAALQVHMKANVSGYTYNTGPGGRGWYVTASPTNPQCYIDRKQGATFADVLVPFYLKAYLPPQTPYYAPISDAQLADRMGSVTNPSPEALAELYRLGEFHMPANPIPDLVDTLRADLEARSPESVDTATIESPTQTKTEERRCATYTQLSGSTVGLVEQCETTTTTQAKDPQTGLPVGDPVVETTTTGSTTPDPAVKPQEETKAEAVCGGPGLPSCNVKVDESGTPTGEAFGDSVGLDTALGNRDAGLAASRDMAGDTGWGIVPTWMDDRACQPWDIFSLPDFIGGDVVTVDLCPIMPLAEGILNFIWVCVGMFAVTSMVASALTGKGT